MHPYSSVTLRVHSEFMRVCAVAYIPYNIAVYIKLGLVCNEKFRHCSPSTLALTKYLQVLFTIVVDDGFDGYLLVSSH